MIGDQLLAGDSRLTVAVGEMRQLIQRHYPGAAFRLSHGDDPEGIWLTVSVDIEDPDVIVDLIIDRLLTLQIDDELPLYVLPVRSPDRVAEMMERRGRGITRPVSTSALTSSQAWSPAHERRETPQRMVSEPVRRTNRSASTRRATRLRSSSTSPWRPWSGEG